MSSIGQTVGGIVGGAVGFFVGGPTGASYGAQIGSTAGGLIDPPKGPSINGPRLSDLSIQTSTYGAYIPRVYGTVAIFGNIFWLEHNQLKEVVQKKKSGGKGGGKKTTTTTYSYFATFAVGICQGPITCVRRVWVGHKLIYDVASDDIETIIASNQESNGFSIYTGSEDQEPDPRMQADIGVANTPAHRGVAYIVFYDYPLVDHGNTLLGAQVKVEVIKNAGLSSFARFVTVLDTGVQFRTNSYPSAPRPYITSVDGAVIVGSVGSTTEYVFSLSGDFLGNRTANFVPIQNNKSFDGSFWYSCGKMNGIDVWVNPNANESGESNIQLVYSYIDGNPNGGRLDLNLPIDRQIMSVNISNDELSAIIIMGNVGQNVSLGASTSSAIWLIIDYNGNVLSSGAVGGTVSIYTFGFARNARYHYAACCYDQDSGLIAVAYGVGNCTTYRIGSDNVLRVIDSSILSDTLFTSPSIYASGNIVFVVNSNDYNVFTWNIPTANQTLLSDVISGECAQSNVLTPSDIDVTELVQSVRGYRVAQIGAIRGAIEPLQAAWPFDIVQSGYQIKFKPRGNSSILTIDSDELDAHSEKESIGSQLSIVNEMDIQLPKKVSLKYLDVNREYDNNEQYAERLTTDSINILESELPIVLNASEAAGMAEVLLYLYWLERRDISFRLPPSYRQLEPADVITITGEFGDHELRLTQVHLMSDGRLECTAKYNSTTVYVPTATGDEGHSTGSVITLGGPSFYALIDCPLLRDQDDEPGYLSAMCGYATGWTGGVIYRSSDGGQNWVNLQGFTGPVTLGFTQNTISAGRTDIIDTANSLTVKLLNGELESVSEITLLSGENHFAYGSDGRWEIIGSKTCTLQGDGSYILTDLLRGRFGTEQYMTTHAIGDLLVLLNDSDVTLIGESSENIGLSRLYRGITSGKTIDTDSDRTFSYQGVNLKPISPIYLNGNRHPTNNNWTLTWFRRGRVSSAWRDFVDVPIGETTESYEIEIYSSGAFTTIKRTLTATSATVTYTSSEQIADFGSNQSTLHVKIYQMSSIVGRGYPLTTSITR